MPGEDWEEIPDYGDVMTVEEFGEHVRGGMFIDYDGWGNYIKDGKMSRKHLAHPSDFLQDGAPEGFTHVCWFNK